MTGSKRYHHTESLAHDLLDSTRHPDQLLVVICTVFTIDNKQKGHYEFPICAIPQIGDWVTLRSGEFWEVVRRAIDARDPNHMTEIWLWVKPMEGGIDDAA